MLLVVVHIIFLTVCGVHVYRSVVPKQEGTLVLVVQVVAVHNEGLWCACIQVWGA